MQFTSNNEIRRVEAKSDPLSSVFDDTAPSSRGLIDTDSDDSLNKSPAPTKKPLSTSSLSESGESSTDEGESSKYKFCERVDELMESSGITETNEIKKMKESYTKLKLEIKQNLDKVKRSKHHSPLHATLHTPLSA